MIGAPRFISTSVQTITTKQRSKPRTKDPQPRLAVQRVPKAGIGEQTSLFSMNKPAVYEVLRLVASPIQNQTMRMM